MDDVHVCYYCSEPLTERAFNASGNIISDDPDQTEFLNGFLAVLDNEIASLTATITLGNSDEKDGEISGQRIAVERNTDHVQHHTVGFGKGLMMLMMAEAEEENSGFEYENGTYSMAYQWIQEAVVERREYIRAALQEDVEDKV